MCFMTTVRGGGEVLILCGGDGGLTQLRYILPDVCVCVCICVCNVCGRTLVFVCSYQRLLAILTVQKNFLYVCLFVARRRRKMHSFVLRVKVRAPSSGSKKKFG